MRNDADRLADVLDAAQRIAERVQRGRDRFIADEDVQLAIVRLLEIIGEACTGVSREVRERYPDVPWRAAADMRNRVVHGYFDIDLDVVWDAAAREVPKLAARVEAAAVDVRSEEGDG